MPGNRRRGMTGTGLHMAQLGRPRDEDGGQERAEHCDRRRGQLAEQQQPRGSAGIADPPSGHLHLNGVAGTTTPRTYGEPTALTVASVHGVVGTSNAANTT